MEPPSPGKLGQNQGVGQGSKYHHTTHQRSPPLNVNAAVVCKTVMTESHNFELAHLKEKKRWKKKNILQLSESVLFAMLFHATRHSAGHEIT